MFINRIFTRIHKLRNTLRLNNNVLMTDSQRQLSTKPILVRNNVYYTSKRNLVRAGWKQSVIERFKLSDNIPENNELIYRCTMASYLVAAQVSATLGVVIVFGIAVVNYFTDNVNDFLISVPNVELFNMVDTKLQMIIFTTGFILINLVITLFVSKFPVRIYSNPKGDNFIGVFFGVIPKTKKIIEFKAGDVMYTPKNTMLPWSECRYKMKNGKKLIMLDQYFRKPNDINDMLGYTKL